MVLVDIEKCKMSGTLIGLIVLEGEQGTRNKMWLYENGYA